MSFYDLVTGHSLKPRPFTTNESPPDYPRKPPEPEPLNFRGGCGQVLCASPFVWGAGPHQRSGCRLGAISNWQFVAVRTMQADFPDAFSLFLEWDRDFCLFLLMGL